jgi:uncharacterized membrane protein
MMKTLAQYAVEVIAAVWLVIVAVQYLSRYFIGGLNVDYTWAYIGMLALTIVTAALRRGSGVRE